MAQDPFEGLTVVWATTTEVELECEPELIATRGPNSGSLWN